MPTRDLENAAAAWGSSIVAFAVLTGLPTILVAAVTVAVGTALMAVSQDGAALPLSAVALGGALGQTVEMTIANPDGPVRSTIQVVPFGLVLTTAILLGAQPSARRVAARKELVVVGSAFGLLWTSAAVVAAWALAGHGVYDTTAIDTAVQVRVLPLLVVGAGTWPLAHLVASNVRARRAVGAVLVASVGIVVAAGAVVLSGAPPGSWIAGPGWGARLAVLIAAWLVAPNAVGMFTAWALGAPAALDVTGDLLGTWDRYYVVEAAATVPWLIVIPATMVGAAVGWAWHRPALATVPALGRRVGRTFLGLSAVLVPLAWWGGIHVSLLNEASPIGSAPQSLRIAAAPWSLVLPVSIITVAVAGGAVLAASRAGLSWTRLDVVGGYAASRGPTQWVNGVRLRLSDWLRPDGEDETRLDDMVDGWPSFAPAPRDGDPAEFEAQGWTAPCARSAPSADSASDGHSVADALFETERWLCPSCSTHRRSRFCPDCGLPRPSDQ